MNIFDYNDKTKRRFFIAVKKDPQDRVDLKLNYELVEDHFEVVLDKKLTNKEAVEAFNSICEGQAKAGNRGPKFRSVVLYDADGNPVMHES